MTKNLKEIRRGNFRFHPFCPPLPTSAPSPFLLPSELFLPASLLSLIGLSCVITRGELSILLPKFSYALVCQNLSPLAYPWKALQQFSPSF